LSAGKASWIRKNEKIMNPRHRRNGFGNAIRSAKGANDTAIGATGRAMRKRGATARALAKTAIVISK